MREKVPFVRLHLSNTGMCGSLSARGRARPASRPSRNRVADQLARPDAEVVVDLLDHPLRRGHLGLPDCGRCLYVHDDGVLYVDEVVGRVGIEGLPALGAGPARGRISRRQELGHDRCRRPERGIVENGHAASTA